MLSLLTCSVSRLDDFDLPFSASPSPVRVHRRVSKSLGFIKPASSTPRRHRVAKMTIGKPTDFRHEVHLGKEMVPENMVTLWDTARWDQELKKDSRPSPPSSLAPSTVPSSPTNLSRSKRNSITPQKRKPVPSIIPDLPPMFLTGNVAPHTIPLPPSPTQSISERDASQCEPFETLDSLLDPLRRSWSIDESETVHVSETANNENESHYEIALAPEVDADDY